ncbi:MAG: tetratricopeptide repeat protein [bacterium]|nr:tetratricopeptide repeat protein [bacterium]
MTIISEKDRGDPEFLWVHITEAAALEFDGGRYSIAAEKWQGAHRIAQGFDDCDPRLAGSLNNLAIAFRIKRDFDEAERVYRSALKNWDSAAHWVERMQLTQRARSSLFHLRLENKHRKQYDNIARSNYRKLIPAGQAATLNNLAELFHSTNRLKEAERIYHQALQKRIGSMDEQECGVAIINTNLARLSDTFNESPGATFSAAHKSKEIAGFISRAARQGWIVDKPSEFTDEGRLMAAIFLAHLIDHTRLKPLRSKSDS